MRYAIIKTTDSIVLLAEQLRSENVRSTLKYLLVVAMLILAMITSGWAETVVEGGAVSGEWPQDTYVVRGDINVQHGDMLTIAPGSTILFDGPYTFLVEGVLIAQGALPEDPEVVADTTNIEWIYFTQEEGTADENRWGGIRFNGSDPGSKLNWVVIERAYAQGEWPLNNGGGIYIYGASPNIEYCVIRNNKADYFGGGVFIWSAGYSETSTTHFRNNVIARNYAEVSGGGMYVDVTAFKFRNLTVADNEAGGDGNGIFTGPDTDPVFRSCIFWNNGDDNESYFNTGSVGTNEIPLRYCIDNSLGGNNDYENFIFTGGAAFDTIMVGEDEFIKGFYVLTTTSNAIDGGDPFDERWSGTERRPNGSRINMGAWGGTPLAIQSLPVAIGVEMNGQAPLAGYYPLPYSRYNEVVVRQVGVRNVGKGSLTIYFDDLVYDDANSQIPAARFFPRDFGQMLIQPDSIGVIEFEFTGTTIDLGTMYTTYNITTTGGDIEFRLQSNVINPVVRIEPPALDFDNVNLYHPDTLQVVVYNDGDSELEIAHPDAQGNGPPYFQASTDHFRAMAPTIPDTVTDTRPYFLRPGSARIIRIICDPKFVTGSVIDSISARNTDHLTYLGMDANAIGAIINFEYQGEALINVDTLNIAAADYDELIELRTLDFKFVDLADSRTLSMIVTNSGNADLVIDSVVTSHPDFSSNVPDGGVAFDDEFQLDLTFDPASLQTYDVTIDVYTNALNFRFNALGRGTEGAIYFSGNIPDPDFGIPEVWGTGDDKIYICAGPAMIETSSRLTVLDSVEVLFEDPEYYLEINGTLDVRGSETGPVEFAPLVDGETFGGLRFVASSTGTKLKYANISSSSSLPISGNNGQIVSDDYLYNGGGVSIYNSPEGSPSFYNVNITDCTTEGNGGGVWMFQSAPLFVGCLINSNFSEGNGGGIYLWGSSPQIHTSRITDNNTDGNGGGVLFRSNSYGLITNSIISGNVAAGYGGGLYGYDNSSPNFENDIIYANDAVEGATFLRTRSLATPTIRNCVVWGHLGDVVSIDEDSPGSALVRYSILQGKDSISGIRIADNVIDTDPVFADYVDFRPGTSSPLIDGGDPGLLYEDSSFPPSEGEARNDIGIYGGPYANYWGETPLSISFFTNPVSGHDLKIVVNALDNLDATPTLNVQTYDGTEQVSLSAVGTTNDVWYGSLRVEVSTQVIATVSGTHNGSAVSFNRSTVATVFTPGDGGELNSVGGNSLLLPAGAVSSETMMLANITRTSITPPEVVPTDIVSNRWNVQGNNQVFNIAGEVVVSYDRTLVRPGTEESLVIWRYADDEWTKLESSVSVQDGKVHAVTDKAGIFVVASDGTDAVVSTLLPETSALGANYPNPFNPTTTIPFDLASSGQVELTIYNVMGREVANVTKGWYTAGNHMINWDGRSNSGNDVASGVYFYRIMTRPSDGSVGIVQTRKLVLMR